MKRLSYCLIFLFCFFNQNIWSQSITITDVFTCNIVQNEAIVYWNTNITTKSTISLGITSNALTTNYYDSIYTISHKIQLYDLSRGTKYYYKIKSTDSNGNIKFSSVFSFTTGGKINTTDTIAPSVPKNLVAYAVTSKQFTLSWDSCADNSKIKGYIIWGKNKKIATTNSLKNYYTIGSLSSLTLYNQVFGARMSFMVQAYDTAGNISYPSERLIVFTPDASLNYPILKEDSTLFSYEINPTGNPIGGGLGYKNIVNINQAQFIVTDKQQLKYALQIARYGEIIYIADTCSIDLTGEYLTIPGGVTLASGRGNNQSEGAILFSNSFNKEIDFKAMLQTGGDSVTVAGLRLKGPSPEILDHDYERIGVANAFRSKHAKTTIHNCEIWAWDKWAIWLFISKEAYIHHNYIHHTTRAGYGYPIWCGGAGNEVDSYALLEANLFEAGRHCIASSGHLNSWEARYNIFLRRQLYNNLNRHDQGSKGIGGRSVTIKHNLFLSTQQHYGLAPPADSLGFTEVAYNYFRRDSSNAGVVGIIPPNDTATTQKRVSVHDNKYNSEGISLPVASIYANKTSGIAPLTVKFDATGSYDSNAISITRYVWRFGDGDFRGNESRVKNPTYKFKEPGIYNVTLVAYNAYGVPSDVKQKTITVYPVQLQNKHILSIWIKDTYNGPLTNRYTKQILVDSVVVWSDDVAGDEGWQHVIIDISNFGIAESKHRVSSRIYAINGVHNASQEICELSMWTDDFVVFNSDIESTSFELEEMYPPWRQEFFRPPGAPGVGSGLTTEERRSGERSFRLSFSLNANIQAGTWGEVYQNITFK